MSELLTRAAAIPGVTIVGLANYLPLTDIGEGGTFEIEGRSYRRPDEQPTAWRSVVGGRYFEAMGIPLLRGRFPSSADTERGEPVVLIDEVLADRYWPHANSIGAHLLFKNAEAVRRSVIIGMVGNVRWMTAAAAPPGTAYLWFPQQPTREITLVARGNGTSTDAASALRRAMTDINPAQPVSEVRALEGIVAADIARPRASMLMLAGFAMAAVVLVTIGLYGVILFGVLQRTREIGVRTALGARRDDVLRLFMTRGLVVTGIGVAIGVGCSLALGRVAGTLLYGVASHDPLSAAAAAVIVVAVATVATYLPASRATRVDPVVALRRE